jgi:cytochrome c peroxidase
LKIIFQQEKLILPGLNLDTSEFHTGFIAAEDLMDMGHASTVNDPAENGKFRVQTQRNVPVASPYMHIGIFKTLYEVVAFLATVTNGWNT